MASVPPWWPAVAAASLVLPTAVAPLPELLRYAQRLGLERLLTDRGRRKRGVPLLTLALVWLVLAWWGSGRPERVAREMLEETGWTLAAPRMIGVVRLRWLQERPLHLPQGTPTRCEGVSRVRLVAAAQ